MEELKSSCVESFKIDHDRLLRGIYVSRKDSVGGDTVTTFDIRMKRPNTEPAMDIAAVHTLEHLMAVYLRSDEIWSDKILYVGPMGCRTGMYLLLKGSFESEDIVDLIRAVFKFVVDFDGEIPAAKSRECGNYLDHNLAYAKWECKKYLTEVLDNIKRENLHYPE